MLHSRINSLGISSSMPVLCMKSSYLRCQSIKPVFGAHSESCTLNLLQKTFVTMGSHTNFLSHVCFLLKITVILHFQWVFQASSVRLCTPLVTVYKQMEAGTALRCFSKVVGAASHLTPSEVCPFSLAVSVGLTEDPICLYLPCLSDDVSCIFSLCNSIL